MNILIVSESYYPRARGGEVVLWRLSCALSKRGHTVKVITSQLEDTAEHEILNGVEIFRPFPPGHIGKITRFRHLYLKIRHNRKIGRFLHRFLSDNRIDIIYNQAYPLTMLTTRLGRRFRIPVIVSVGSFQEIHDLSFKTIITDLFHLLKQFIILRFARYEAIRCGSEFISKKIRRYTNEIIYTIASPIDDEYMREIMDSDRSREVRESVGMQADELFLLFVGALVPVKNIDGLIKAVAGLKTGFRLIIVGEGPEQSRLEQLISDLQLGDRIVLIGKRDNNETLRIMRAADMVIVSSHIETCGNVIIEALSLETPVISRKTGIATEIESDNLYLVDEVDEITAQIERGIVKKQDRRPLDAYSIDKIVDSYEQMFTAVEDEYGS